ncbi:MAG: Mo-dependent nitrogenase [Leptolyngbyaceae cyanobacterium RU_5_1]|nr:Mo-dependent nitrogenase [Leptolyngbyaceae cyanobacterium RU_5_1]
MTSSRYTTEPPQNNPQNSRFIWTTSEIPMNPISGVHAPKEARFEPLKPIRQWLTGLEIRDRNMAHTLCSVIPAQCPFERTVKLFGRTVLYIPPLCKLNPFYDQVVELRFRALCYLADECGEDISPYC